MRIVDGHVHVGAWEEPGFAGRATTLEDAVALYRRLGFAGALVTTTDAGGNEALRRAIAALPPSPRLRFAWWVDPRREGDLRRLEEGVGETAALKVHPSFLGRAPTEPEFAPYYALARRHGLPVIVHCGRWREVAGFERTLALAEAHPEVRFVLSHMGGDEPLLVRATVDAIRARGIGNAWLGTESLRQYWVVEEAVRRLGAERIVFGSDYNLNHPSAFRAVVDALDLSGAERARILGENLNALLPPHARFWDLTEGSP